MQCQIIQTKKEVKKTAGYKSEEKGKKKKLLKKKPISVVFNYSDLILTEPMMNLLNRGLNFAVKPSSINLSNILTDFKKFERKIKWQEFFSGQENPDYTPPIFKQEKTNLPRNHPTPRPLKVFLNTESLIFKIKLAGTESLSTQTGEISHPRNLKPFKN